MEYKLIHIDTKEVTICDKITIEGNDYYVSDKKDKFTNKFWSINLSSKYTHKEITEIENLNEFERYFLQKECNVLIATTNTSLQCPQVVDYVEELANEHANKVWGIYVEYIDEDCNSTRGENSIKDYTAGYQKHSEKHSMSDEDVLEYSIWLTTLRKYTDIVKHIDFDGSDLYVADELIKVFKSTLLTRIYYK